VASTRPSLPLPSDFGNLRAFGPEPDLAFVKLFSAPGTRGGFLNGALLCHAANNCCYAISHTNVAVIPDYIEVDK